MKKFVERVVASANQFTAFDFALFKIYLFAVGILVGAYFAPFWLVRIHLIWIVAIVAGIFTVVQLVRRYLKLR